MFVCLMMAITYHYKLVNIDNLYYFNLDHQKYQLTGNGVKIFALLLGYNLSNDKSLLNALDDTVATCLSTLVA